MSLYSSEYHSFNQEIQSEEKKKFGLYIRKNKDVIRAQRIDECFQNVKDFEKKKVPGFLIPLYVFYRSKFKLTFHWQNGCH